LSLDPKIVEAIRSATDEAGQPAALSRRLIAWLEAVAEESEDINDIATTDRRLELLYEAVALGEIDVADDEGGDDDDEEETD
jgi:hypothetical protein